MDVNESIEETVLREIREETGIFIEKDLDEQFFENDDFLQKNIIKCSHIRPFFIWESVYPTNLKYGLPQFTYYTRFSLIYFFLN